MSKSNKLFSINILIPIFVFSLLSSNNFNSSFNSSESLYDRHEVEEEEKIEEETESENKNERGQETTTTTIAPTTTIANSAREEDSPTTTVASDKEEDSPTTTVASDKEEGIRDKEEDSPTTTVASDKDEDSPTTTVASEKDEGIRDKEEDIASEKEIGDPCIVDPRSKECEDFLTEKEIEEEKVEEEVIEEEVVDEPTAPPVDESTTTTTTLPPAVFINNQIPDVSPGEAEVYIDNESITTELNIENRSSGTLIADNLIIEFNFSCTENCEYDDSKPKLEIEQDGIIDITTGGFEPGSEVNIWLFSEPKLLGTFIADETGAISSILSIPDVTDGYHTLQVQGVNKNGEDLTANLGVEVFTKKTVLGAFEIKINIEDFSEILDLDIEYEAIENIPTFEEVDVFDLEKTQQATTSTAWIVALFYIVLISQEWFNRIVDEYYLKSTTSLKEKLNKLKSQFYNFRESKSDSRLKRYLKIGLVIVVTSLLMSFVEEGATLEITNENIAIVIATFIALIVVTLAYDGIEMLIENIKFDQVYKLTWAPQAMIFALVSTVAFIYFNLAIGFIFGFVATISSTTSREQQARISPKFYSMTSLTIIGVVTFLLTSIEYINSREILLATLGLIYLMSLEGIVFKSMPGGGSELTDAIEDSTGYRKALPFLIFAVSVFLFMRIIVIPADSEVADFQNTLNELGSVANTIGWSFAIYFAVIFIFGNLLKYFGVKEA